MNAIKAHLTRVAAAAACGLMAAAIAAYAVGGSVLPPPQLNGDNSFSALSVNNTTAVLVHAGNGRIDSLQLGGIGTVPVYVKLYDSAAQSCGSGTPKARFPIPVNPTAANAAGSNIALPTGMAFGTGISYCITVGIADADTTPPVASVYLVNMQWQ